MTDFLISFSLECIDFLKNILLGMRSFLSALENIVASWPPWLLIRNSLSFKLFFLWESAIYFIATLNIFFVVLSLQDFNYEVSRCRSLWVYSVWGFYRFLNLWFYDSTNLGSFQSIFLWVLFLASRLSPGTLMIQMLHLFL